MENNEFLEVMRKKETDELLEILNVQRFSYRPKAIEAVEIVLNERNVEYTKITDVELKQEDIAKASVAEAAYVANNWLRLGEYIIDSAIIYIFSEIIDIVLYSLGFNSFVVFLVNLLIIAIYYYFLENKYEKTIGKILLRMKVVDINGNKPSSDEIALRTLCRFIPFDALSFISGGWENHTLKTNWHDRFSKTYVVSEKKLLELNKKKTL